ncbi:MAG: flagellar filament capping protein FliD [Planctomycetota bacterium]
MGIALSGVYSGIDTSSIVRQLMATERTALNSLQDRKKQLGSEQNAIDEIERRIGQLSDAVDSLREVDDLRRVDARSSDDDVVSVSSEPGAVEGNHTVEVNALASAHRMVQTTGLASLETTVGAGQFVYTYDGTTRTLTTTDATTLEGLRALIANDAGNPGVSATVLEQGGTYHLVLAGKNPGSDYTVTVEADTTLTGFAGADFTTTRLAQDSQIKVDGFPPAADEWIERSSNQITDVIPGLTLNLEAVGSVSVTATRNTSDMKRDLKNFISVYNGVVDKLDEYTGYDRETKTGGVLQGDATLNTLLHDIRRDLSRPAAGFNAEADTYTLAGQLGLEFDRQGHLELDETVFDEALDADYDAVLSVLGAVDTGSTDSADLQFTSAYQTQGGTYDVRIQYDADGAIDWAKVKLTDETGWRYLTVNGMTLTGLAGEPEQGMELTVVNAGTSQTLDYRVRVRQGLAGAIYDETEAMMDESTGVFTVKDDRIDGEMERFEKRIERENDRLERREKHLRQKYARLEKTLAEMGSFQAAFQSVFASQGGGGGMTGMLQQSMT